MLVGRQRYAGSIENNLAGKAQEKYVYTIYILFFDTSILGKEDAPSGYRQQKN